jgi:hypothetical protein
MRFAYADPPYLGQGKKRYSEHPEAGVYDTVEGHQQLIERLCDEFPDGWALSMSSVTLRTLLPLCPEDVRVMAWVKPWAVFRKGVNPAYGWEPVIVRGGRKHRVSQPTVTDWIAVSITRQRGTVGAKPEAFVWWVLSVLNVKADDEFVDLFPGSKAVSRAWEAWQRQGKLWEPPFTEPGTQSRMGNL